VPVLINFIPRESCHEGDQHLASSLPLENTIFVQNEKQATGFDGMCAAEHE
jgi:hypothetical protein